MCGTVENRCIRISLHLSTLSSPISSSLFHLPHWCFKNRQYACFPSIGHVPANRKMAGLLWMSRLRYSTPTQLSTRWDLRSEPCRFFFSLPCAHRTSSQLYPYMVKVSLLADYPGNPPSAYQVKRKKEKKKNTLTHTYTHTKYTYTLKDLSCQLLSKCSGISLSSQVIWGACFLLLFSVFFSSLKQK